MRLPAEDCCLVSLVSIGGIWNVYSRMERKVQMTAHSKHMLCRVSSVPACVFYIWKLHAIIHDLQYGTCVDRSTHTWGKKHLSSIGYH